MGKLNWQINPKHKLVGNFHYDKHREDNGLDIGSTPSTAWSRRTQDAHPRPRLHRRAVGQDRRRRPLLGLLRQGDRLPHRSQPAARPAPVLRPRHRPRSPAATTTGTSWSPSARRPPPRSRTSRTTSWAPTTTSGSACSTATRWRGGSTATTTSSTPTASTSPGYGFGYDRTPFSYTRRQPLHRRVPGRHGAGERPALPQPGRALRPQQGLLGRAGRARRARQPHRDVVPADRLLHLEDHLAAPGLQLEGHRRRQDGAQGPLGPLPPRRWPPASSPTCSSPSVEAHVLGSLRPRHRAVRRPGLLRRATANLGVDPDYKAPRTDQFVAEPGAGARPEPRAER